MKILHTSDWHIGHKLYGRHRHEEFSQFLQWLEKTISEQQIDVLIVAGDIFDSQSPSNQSLALYYTFLSAISISCCRHIIIVGGNHDSPTLLNGPQNLLQHLNIHVIGCTPETITDELIILNDKNHTPEAIILAVPYLRDKDIRSSASGESSDAKQLKTVQGIHTHYATLVELASKTRDKIGTKIPIIATGHLFCQGGKTRQGDGIRELYVGTLVHVGLDCFPDTIDYLALGHLHLPQMVKKQNNRRYCGSPLAMNFSEASEQKIVLVVNFSDELSVQEHPIPCFQALQQITGDLDHIIKSIEDLHAADKSILLEVQYTGSCLVDDLQEQIASAVENTQLDVLRISNKRIYNHALRQTSEIKVLEELSPHQVFQQCLDLSEIPLEQQLEMTIDFITALERVQRSEQ